MRRVSTHEAKTHLSRLISAVQAGEEITIYRGDQPAARLVPLASSAEVRRRPEVGTRTSAKVTYTPDAFEPLTDRDLEDWGL